MSEEGKDALIERVMNDVLVVLQKNPDVAFSALTCAAAFLIAQVAKPSEQGVWVKRVNDAIVAALGPASECVKEMKTAHLKVIQ